MTQQRLAGGRGRPAMAAALGATQIGAIVYEDTQDQRAAAGAAVLAAVVFWVIFRPEGFGHKINEWDRRQIEANGGRKVRWEWVVRAAILLPMATIVPLFVLVWMGQR